MNKNHIFNFYKNANENIKNIVSEYIDQNKNVILTYDEISGSMHHQIKLIFLIIYE